MPRLPKVTLTDEHKKFLCDLRDSGEVNMWLAAPYVEDEFDVSTKEARAIVVAWIKTFTHGE